MSPELFKCFVCQLSEEINCFDGVEAPGRIMHLLWAENLALMVLTTQILQHMPFTPISISKLLHIVNL